MYTKKERIAIGKEIYTGEITKAEAMAKYGIHRTSVDNYVRLFKDSQGIPRKLTPLRKGVLDPDSSDLERYQAMSKEELIDELILARANELRAKKGYEVKGGGAHKEFVVLSEKNSK